MCFKSTHNHYIMCLIKYNYDAFIIKILQIRTIVGRQTQMNGDPVSNFLQSMCSSYLLTVCFFYVKGDDDDDVILIY